MMMGNSGDACGVMNAETHGVEIEMMMRGILSGDVLHANVTSNATLTPVAAMVIVMCDENVIVTLTVVLHSNVMTSSACEMATVTSIDHSTCRHLNAADGIFASNSVNFRLVTEIFSGQTKEHTSTTVVKHLEGGRHQSQHHGIHDWDCEKHGENCSVDLLGISSGDTAHRWPSSSD
jgi:hypothetical protein